MFGGTPTIVAVGTCALGRNVDTGMTIFGTRPRVVALCALLVLTSLAVSCARDGQIVAVQPDAPLATESAQPTTFRVSPTRTSLVLSIPDADSNSSAPPTAYVPSEPFSTTSSTTTTTAETNEADTTPLVLPVPDPDIVAMLRDTAAISSFVIEGTATNYAVIDEIRPSNEPSGPCGYALVTADVAIIRVHKQPTDIARVPPAAQTTAPTTAQSTPPTNITVRWFLECPVDLSNRPARALIFLEQLDGPRDDTEVANSMSTLVAATTTMPIPVSERTTWDAVENATFALTPEIVAASEVAFRS